MNVSQIIGAWYDSNKRLLPWRETRNPYHIWISEIILQQTRVNQGFAYYERFIKNFPTLHDLAVSRIEDVLILWQGLGYYSRARNMLKAAQIMDRQYEGQIPETYEELIRLPGIGEYTASAIASLAYNIPLAAIDGNVYRVLARYFGIESPPDTSRGRKEFRLAAEELLDRKDPGRHNQAMIELGALVCLPKSPVCDRCPLNTSCFALKANCIHRLPAKKKAVRTQDRYFYYLVIQKNDRIFIRQRGEGDIWALLYDFPLIETKRAVTVKTLLKSQEWQSFFGDQQIVIKRFSEEFKHVLSHQVLHAYFIELEVKGSFSLPRAKEIYRARISDYPVPRLIDKYFAAD
jgi:A/G-specific adenine glycosylase